MENNNNDVYKKHNSFEYIIKSSKSSHAACLNKVMSLYNDPLKYSTIKHNFNDILDSAINDILYPDPINNSLQMQLTNNVIDEIQSCSKTELARYLVHRYRYEIFPKKKILDDYPPYLQIEPSSMCNYRCVFCFETDKSFTKKSNGYMGKMNYELFTEIIDQAYQNIEFISLASRGEPLMSRDISKMLNYCNGKFLNLKLNTNASLITEEICHAILSGSVKTLVFSADAAEEPLYSTLRVNGSLSKIIDNVKLFKTIREKHYPRSSIITRVSGVKMNESQNIDSMQNLWSELVDQVAFVKYNPWENVYNKDCNRISEPCSDLWRRMFIWWDGKINPCDVDYKSLLQVGEISSSNISQIWKSSNYQELRDKHISQERSTINPCSRCVVL